MSDIYRRCGCRDTDGKAYGPLHLDATAAQHARTCPRLLDDDAHGSWSFYATGTDPDTRERVQVRKSGFANQTAARKARNQIVAKLDRGVYVPPTPVTLREWMAEWLPQHRVSGNNGRGLKATSYLNYERYARLDIAPSALGPMPLSTIRPQHINRFVADLSAAGRGDVTVRRIVAVLQAAMKAAKTARIIEENPAVGLALPKIERAEANVWEPEEAGRFLDVAAGNRLGPLFELALYSGLRRGEILGLRWEDVNLGRNQLTVRRNRTQVGGKVVEQTPKSRSGWRTVPLAADLVGTLLAWQLRQANERAEWGVAYSDQGYVFTRENGEPIYPQYVTKLFDRLRVQAELPTLTLHGLRHTGVSLLITAGVPIAVVSKMVGHSSIQITADRYGHLIGTAAQDAADAMAALVPRAHKLHTIGSGAETTKSPASR
jgi:integrase